MVVFQSPTADSAGRLARAGAQWSGLLLVARQIITFAATAIIARILSASDFGIVAMMATVTSFLMLISDMGLSWATVQKEGLEKDHIDSLFWTSTFLGAGGWLLCGLITPVVAAFYATPVLMKIGWVVGFGLLLTGASHQPLALLKRQMRQRELATAQTLGVLGASSVGILLAWMGAGYWALALQSIVSSAVTLVIAMHWSGYRPSWPKKFDNAKSLLTFGGYIGACNILTYLQVQMDGILVGRYLGPEDLGYYTRALSLRAIPATYAAAVLTDVMIPALVALRGDPQRLANAYVNTVRSIALIGFPLAAGLGVAAGESVRILYGPNWAPVVPLLAWLSLPALVLPLSQSMGWLFVASGRTKEMFLLTLLTLPIAPALYYYAIKWGVQGVAMTVALIFTVPLPLLTAYVAHRLANLELSTTLKALRPIAIASGGAVVMALGVGYWASALGAHWLLALVLKLMAGSIAYLVAVLALVNPIPLAPLERLALRLQWR